MAAVFRVYYALGPGVSHALARLLDEEAERQGVTLLQWLGHRPYPELRWIQPPALSDRPPLPPYPTFWHSPGDPNWWRKALEELLTAGDADRRRKAQYLFHSAYELMEELPARLLLGESALLDIPQEIRKRFPA